MREDSRKVIKEIWTCESREASIGHMYSNEFLGGKRMFPEFLVRTWREKIERASLEGREEVLRTF